MAKKSKRSTIEEMPTGASRLLWRALHAFVIADYHPWLGIEQRIREALNHSFEDQVLLLHEIKKMLGKSDLETTRALGREIAAYLAGTGKMVKSSGHRFRMITTPTRVE